LKFFSDGYQDERILKWAWGRGIRDEDDKGCYDREGGTIYEEVSDIFANFRLKRVLNLEPSSLDLSGMGEGYYYAILFQLGS
jgi:hypothetical protein